MYLAKRIQYLKIAAITPVINLHVFTYRSFTIKMISQQPSCTFIGRCLQNAPLPRRKILQALRGHLEQFHRLTLRDHTFVHQFYRIRIDDPHYADTLPEMNIKQANDCCNKTIPIYICNDHRTKQFSQSPLVLGLALHNWLYQKWFRPYRTDIEWGQFIAKIFECPRVTKWQGLEPSAEDIIDMTVRLNYVICNRIEAAQKRILEQEAAPDSTMCNGLVCEQPFCELQRDQSSFILQPLFRAVVMVIQEKDHTIDMTDMSGVVVYLAVTGVEDGLSAPIPLNSVEQDPWKLIYDQEGSLRAVCTTLETAYNFIKELQCREEAAFGLRPDPVKDSKGLRAGYLSTAAGMLSLARELGWQSEWEPLEYPSSRWADNDTNLIRKWEGGGERWDRVMRSQEE